MKSIIIVFLVSIFVHAQVIVEQKNEGLKNNLLIQTFPSTKNDNQPTNVNKLLEEIIAITVENGKHFNNMKLFFNYDNRANIICRGSANWINNTWVEERKTCYEFNGDNNKTYEYSQENVDNEWLTYAEELFTYDDNDQLLKWVRKDNQNDYAREIENSHMDEYLYDNIGNQIEEVSSMWLDWEEIPRWEYQRKVERVFNNSALIEESFYWWNTMDSSWDNTSKTIYTFNQTGNLSRTDHYYYEEGKWNNSRRLLLVYDEYNNIIDSLEQDWRDGEWHNDSQTQFEYNTNNLLVRENWFWWDYFDGSLKWNGINYYKYNDKNLMSEFLEETYNGGIKDYSRRVEFFYDLDGDISYLNIYMLDNGNWDYLAKNIYNYKTITNANENSIVLNDYKLQQNYPNPFNPSTIIKYSIPKQSNVTLKVFDVLGGEIATLVNQEQAVGNYDVEFDGSDLTSGIYFYRIQVYTLGRAGDFVETRKMLLLK